MPPRLLKVLVDVTVRPFSNILKRSWHLGKVPDDWKNANISAIFRKDKEEDPGNYNLLCLHSVTRKIMEPVLPETLSRCMKNKKVMGSSQHVLGRAHCAWPSFSDQMASGVDKRKSMNIVYLDSSEIFHSILIAKSERCG